MQSASKRPLYFVVANIGLHNRHFGIIGTATYLYHCCVGLGQLRTQ